MKKMFLAVLAIAIVGFMSMGCFTTMLWEGKRPNVITSNYTDSIQSFLMSQDSKKIIFISHDYHYILNSNPSLSFLLTHKDDINISYELPKGSYYVIDNTISATFTANLNIKTLPPELIKEALSQRDGVLNKETGIIHYSLHVNGTRYQGNAQVNNKIVKFDHPIVLNINQSESKSSAGETLKTIALTPLSLAADGATIVLGAGALAIGVITLPITIPLFVIMDTKSKHK